MKLRVPAVLLLILATLLALPAACAPDRRPPGPPQPMIIPPPQGARPVQQFRLSDALLERVKERSQALSGVKEITVFRFASRRPQNGASGSPVLSHYSSELTKRGWYAVLQQTEGTRGAAYASPDGSMLVAVAVRPDGFTVAEVRGKVALESIPELERALVRSLGSERDVVPHRARTALARARDLERSGKPEEAEKTLKDAVVALPRVVLLREGLAAYYRRQGRPADSVAELKAVVALDPAGYSSRLNYAVALYESKMYKDALFEFAQASALAPDKGTPGYYIGRIYEEQDQPSEAVRAYEKAAALAPHWMSVQMRLGALYEKSGDLVKAADAYRRALDIARAAEARGGNPRPDPARLKEAADALDRVTNDSRK